MDDVCALVNIYVDLFETPGPIAARVAEQLWVELVALVGLSEAQGRAAEVHRARSGARRSLVRGLTT